MSARHVNADADSPAAELRQDSFDRRQLRAEQTARWCPPEDLPAPVSTGCWRCAWCDATTRFASEAPAIVGHVYMHATPCRADYENAQDEAPLVFGTLHEMDMRRHA